jgi:hypothetical protein
MKRLAAFSNQGSFEKALSLSQRERDGARGFLM